MMDTKKTPYGSPVRKLCIVVDNLDSHAGWGRLATEVGRRFNEYGWEVAYIVNSGIVPERGIAVPMRNVASLRSLRSLIRSLGKIRRYVRDFDIILCYDVNPYGIILSLATIGLATKVVINALGTYSLFTSSWVRNALIAWTYRNADRVLMVSEFVRKNIEKNDFKFKVYHIVPVGVDTKQFSRTAVQVERESYILSVGGVKHRKGYHLTVAAFSRIAARYPRLRYIIVGTKGHDEYTKQIEKIIHEEGITDRIIFRTDVSDSELVTLYSGAEVYVQTSVTDTDSIEGFGMSYLEASSCGAPTIGARDSGAQAAINDGVTGFLVSHDPDDIAHAIIRILDDRALAAAMGKAGVAYAQQFTWERVFDTYRMHLEDLVR